RGALSDGSSSFGETLLFHVAKVGKLYPGLLPEGLYMTHSASTHAHDSHHHLVSRGKISSPSGRGRESQRQPGRGGGSEEPATINRLGHDDTSTNDWPHATAP